jgi:hypothetical protein
VAIRVAPEGRVWTGELKATRPVWAMA